MNKAPCQGKLVNFLPYTRANKTCQGKLARLYGALHFMGHFVWHFFAFNFTSILRVVNTQHGLKMVTAKITFPVISSSFVIFPMIKVNNQSNVQYDRERMMGSIIDLCIG